MKVAFVATGGASRGIAHLGVLYACESLGIRPDIFVGASAGAVVAASYGQDLPLDQLVDGYRSPWHRKYKGPHLSPWTFLGPPSLQELRHLGLLASGVFSLHRFEAFLRDILPINDFRRLPHPVLVSAVDLDSAKRTVFGSGYEESVPISEAVAASCCIPGLFRPYRIGGSFYLDGEVVRTLSADLALRAGADVVLVSNIYPPAVVGHGHRSYGRRSALQILTQSLNIVLTEKERTGMALYAKNYPHARFVDISPDVGGSGYLNAFASRSLLMRAYREAKRQLERALAEGLLDESAYRTAPADPGLVATPTATFRREPPGEGPAVSRN